jgi:hypothetical protein
VPGELEQVPHRDRHLFQKPSSAHEAPSFTVVPAEKVREQWHRATGLQRAFPDTDFARRNCHRVQFNSGGNALAIKISTRFFRARVFPFVNTIALR